MLKHPDPEIQLLVEMLEGQRDSAMVEAAALFRRCKELEKQIAEMTVANPGKEPGNDR